MDESCQRKLVCGLAFVAQSGLRRVQKVEAATEDKQSCWQRWYSSCMGAALGRQRRAAAAARRRTSLSFHATAQQRRLLTVSAPLMVCKITTILTTTQINMHPKELKELSIVVAAAKRRAAAAAGTAALRGYRWLPACSQSLCALHHAPCTPSSYHAAVSSGLGRLEQHPDGVAHACTSNVCSTAVCVSSRVQQQRSQRRHTAAAAAAASSSTTTKTYSPAAGAAITET